MRYVFCYGTLRAGEINDIGRAAATHGIAAPRLVGAVAVAGRLYDFGNYPGMVAGGGRDLVWGDVYAIDERLVPVLDEIEEVYPGVEGLFVRQRASVELGGRRSNSAGAGTIACITRSVRTRSRTSRASSRATGCSIGARAPRDA